MQTIDITPTWGEWANVYASLAASGEGAACKALRADLAKMAAAAQALKDIRADLPEHLQDRVSHCLGAELGKQGYA
ncbi:hypothetical protein [Achromobacter sp.]|uniref:hypothetical protein n=1 Tax=Achromobacter sp. TaxID=134375 RepID=UPI0028A6DE29|nr:hypothetical protein [Achromobacter sp.]